MYIYVQNKFKVTSIVVPCRPCSSKRRILAIYWVFEMLSTVHSTVDSIAKPSKSLKFAVLYFYFVAHLQTSFLAKRADHVNKD